MPEDDTAKRHTLVGDYIDEAIALSQQKLHEARYFRDDIHRRESERKQ